MHMRLEMIGGPTQRSRAFVVHCAAFALALLLSGTAAYAAEPENPALAEFKRAHESAIANAKGVDKLDPAYELLGVAGNARERGLKDLADSAAAAFTDLVQRATVSALRAGGATAQDALDQLVDLRSFAETTQIEKTATVVDGAMRQLFPVVAKSIEQRVNAASEWDEKLAALRDLASIEASSAQVLLTDSGAPIGAAFDRHIAALEAKANAQSDHAERTRELSGIEDLKRSRTEQIAEATANNVSALAKQMQSSGRTAGSSQDLESEDRSDLPPELSQADGSCIETGYRADKNTADLRRAHDRECVNSGRIPIQGHCSVVNVSMVCHAGIADGEKLTYAYAGTVAETYFRKTCPEADRVPGDKVTISGVPFREATTKLTFTCAPTGNYSAGD